MPFRTGISQVTRGHSEAETTVAPDGMVAALPLPAFVSVCDTIPALQPIVAFNSRESSLRFVHTLLLFLSPEPTNQAKKTAFI
jgi:hypothetical protein